MLASHVRRSARSPSMSGSRPRAAVAVRAANSRFSCGESHRSTHFGGDLPFGALKRICPLKTSACRCEPKPSLELTYGELQRTTNVSCVQRAERHERERETRRGEARAPHQIHQLDALGDIERFGGDGRRRSCRSMVPVSGREKGSRDERVDAWCGENGRCTSAHICGILPVPPL